MTSNVRVLAGAFAGALVVVIIGWYLFLYGPRGDEIDEVRDDIETAEQEEQTLRATLSRLRSIDENRPELEADLRRLTAAVPETPQLASFILAVHEEAAKADLSFMSITPAVPTASDIREVSVMSTGMELEGTFFSVLDFLDRLQDLERVVVVDSIDLSASLETGEAEGAGGPAAPAGTSGAAGVTTTTLAAPGGEQPGDPNNPDDPDDPDEVVTLPGRDGDVVTDRGTLEASGQAEDGAGGTDAGGGAGPSASGDPRSGEAQGDATVALVERPEPVRAGTLVIQVSLQTRLFTTAAPPSQTGGEGGDGGGGGGGTTTSQPGDAEGE